MIDIESLTDRVVAYGYKHLEEKELKKAENYFLQKEIELHDQFIDWFVYDFKLNNGQTLAEVYLKSHQGTLTSEEIVALKLGMESSVGIYEVVEKTEVFLKLKNILTHEEYRIEQNILNDLSMYSLVVARIVNEMKNKIYSPRIIILPYQYKTILTGQIIEDFDLARQKNRFINYHSYFKQNLPRLLETINKIVSYGQPQEDITLFQSIYVTADFEGVKTKLFNHSLVVFEEEDTNYYFNLLDKESQNILAQLVLYTNKIEIEANSKEERERAKEVIQEILCDKIAHLKDEELGIEDLLN